MNDTFLLDHSYKSFPARAQPCRSDALGALGWNVLADDLAYPLATLRQSALAHNLSWMQDFARRKGVQLAPHGKTTMSPELFDMQLKAGAWGLTFATIFQLAVGVRAGARRAIIANQVLSDADLDALAALLAQHDGLRVWFLVDSRAQLAMIEAWARRRRHGGRFDALLEIGVPGQRTGVRHFDDAIDLARAIQRSSAVRLGGVECYEGHAANCDNDHDVREVSALLRRVNEVVRACDAQDLFEDEQILLTAGGSAVFDLVIPMLRTAGLSRRVTGVLRSGCYLTHDHGNYRRYLAQVERREGLDDSLRPALEVWSMVQSVPEEGLALLTCGRRDISHDIEMPIPVRLARLGERIAASAPAGWKVTALNDQHAYLRFDAAGIAPAVGDRVALGISHPCTTFDKWRWMALVDDEGGVRGAVHTCF
ncbi:amino acid deaminase [Variovorax dokdonensis]|uniref:Amino acid deaminase n=1 Tax=Variovorax dokdonensis TaxID=344883 RepID=A0ABT7N7J2_9BURK|nr:amino acid deaminase [Variovorax dokdonensis]MDM0043918.1 amino acid deaminase [Variovorax dokdonensis]